MEKGINTIINESGIIDPIGDEQVGKKVHEICQIKYNYYYFINNSLGYEDTLPLEFRREDDTVSFADYVSFFGEKGKRYYAELVDINNCLNYGWADSWFDINNIIDYILGKILHFDVVVVDVLNDTSIVGEDGCGRFSSKKSFDLYRSQTRRWWLPSLIMDNEYSFIYFNPMGNHFPYYILLTNYCCDQFVDNICVHSLDPNQDLDEYHVTKRF